LWLTGAGEAGPSTTLGMDLTRFRG
jgi:hypothetical protein